MILSAPLVNSKPFSEKEIQAIKDEYTEGKEYFVFTGTIHPQNNLVGLLKAFSIFKKRQLSNFKLVIAGRTGSRSAAILKSVETYQFRKDVIVKRNIDAEEMRKFVAGAYALIDLSSIDKNESQILNAMVYGTPVIAHTSLLVKKTDEEFVLLVDPKDHHAVASQMMALYKDERMRSALIEQARQRAQTYHAGRVASLFWDLIQQTSGSSA